MLIAVFATNVADFGRCTRAQKGRRRVATATINTKKPDLHKVGLRVLTAEAYYATAVEMRNVAATVKIAYNSGNAARISVLPITS